jgi:beta-glucosidase
MQGVSKEELKQLMSIFVTYDPMNLGVPVELSGEG